MKNIDKKHWCKETDRKDHLWAYYHFFLNENQRAK